MDAVTGNEMAGCLQLLNVYLSSGGTEKHHDTTKDKISDLKRGSAAFFSGALVKTTYKALVYVTQGLLSRLR